MERNQELSIICRICGGLYHVNVDSADIERYNNGGHAQDVFHYLTDGERELIISKTCNDCFDEIFAEED